MLRTDSSYDVLQRGLATPMPVPSQDNAYARTQHTHLLILGIRNFRRLGTGGFSNQ